MKLVHNMNIVTIMFLTIHFHVVKSQENPQPPQNLHPSPEIISPIHPTIPVIAGIVCVMFSLTFLLCAYVKFCNNPFLNSSRHLSEFQGVVASTRPRFSTGVDKNIIESLPFFRFSSLKGSKEGLECAVCISRFEDSEVLRLLPTCKHAFHVACIDQWLESHATCPLCRHALDARALKNVSFTNSLRYGLEGGSNLSNHLEVFVERAHEGPELSGPSGSFRKLVNFGSFRKLGKKKNSAEERMLLHEFKHKIVVSGVMEKNRWSDLNSSDFLLLSSEMISASSSERFSLLGQTEKVKEDMDRKRLIDLKFGGNIVDRTDMVSDLGQTCTNNVERRSMSEMTYVSRFSVRSRIKDSFSGQEDEEATRRLVWLPIAQRTVRWFAGRERTLSLSEAGPSNV